MPVTSIGDMAQKFTSMRAGGQIKSDLARLSASLSSGRVTDIPHHLSGETARYNGINHKLVQLEGFRQAATETNLILDNMQKVLGRADATRAHMAKQMLLVGGHSTNAQVDEAARIAAGAFETIVSALNTRIADRALFGGRQVDTAPLLSADAIMTDIKAAIGTDRSVAGITAAIKDWFDDPAGGFATTGYQGDTGPMLQRQIAEGRKVDISARADDPAIRDLLKSTLLAAVTTDLPGLAADDKAALVQAAGTGLLSAATGMAAIQSRIGTAQEAVATAQVEMNAQTTSLKTAVNDLVSADPFDTATRLKSVEMQLQTHYSVIGRLSELSLLRFI